MQLQRYEVRTAHLTRVACRSCAQVTPHTGLAAVFSQALLHEGSPLASGVKYLVRTDIVYKARGRHVPKVHMDRLLPFDSVA